MTGERRSRNSVSRHMPRAGETMFPPRAPFFGCATRPRGFASRASKSPFGRHAACGRNCFERPLPTDRSGNERRAPLEKQRVAPYAVELRDPLAASDDAEADAFVQPQARDVLREDARLDRPDPF